MLTEKNHNPPDDSSPEDVIGGHIRAASETDAAAIAEIYSEAILARDSTMDLEPWTRARAASLVLELKPRESVFVYDDVDSVKGWGIVKLYSDRPGYAVACETSLYVKRSCTGRGIGHLIQARLLEAARENGFHHVLTRIWAANQGSIRFHERFGFTLVGIQREIGMVDGARKDIAVMQCLLD